MALSALFASSTLGLATNQVASGLALTILGLGLSGLIGASFVGIQREAIPAIHIPGLSDLPMVGQLVFGEDPFVYLSLCDRRCVLVPLPQPRRTDAAFHRREPRLGPRARAAGACACACSPSCSAARCAGLAGAYLSLVYTPFWSPGMTAGRGWIALALVVFASWQPLRVLFGAYLFGGRRCCNCMRRPLRSASRRSCCRPCPTSRRSSRWS